MKYNIVNIALSLSALCLGCSHKTVTFNAGIKKEYESIAGKFPPIFQKENMLIADTAKFKLDTLNMSDRRPRQNVRVVEVMTENLGKQIDTIQSPNQMEKYAIWFSYARASGDSLIIVLGYPLSRKFIEHGIINNQVTTTYREEDKYDAFVTLDPQKPIKKSVIVPAQTLQFELSSKTYLTDSVFYGKATFVSDPFFTKDDHFKSGFFKQRVRAQYLFKVNRRK